MTGASNWSIARRLGAGFAVLLVVLATLVSLITWRLAQNERASEALDAVTISTQRIDEFERALLLLALSTRDMQREATRQQRDDFELAQRRLDAALRALEADARARELVSLGARFASAARRAVAEGESADVALVPMRQAAFARARSMLEQQDAEVGAALRQMRSNREQATAVLISGAVITGLLFLGIAIMTTRSVSLPARELVVVATALREGDWGPALRLDRADPERGKASASEMVQIGRAFGAAAAQLEVRGQRLAAHAAIANASGASLDRQQIAEAALRVVMQHLQAEVGAVFAEGTEPGLLAPVAARCVSGTLAPVREGEGLVGQCARDRATLVWHDMPADSPFAVGLGSDPAPARSVAATPLMLGGELLGVLVAASLRDFDDDAVSFLEAAAAVVAVGMMNARAYEEVQQLLAKLQQQAERIQAQNEELQAQNEEIQAQNEELQAQGEELHAQSDDLQRQTAQLHEQADALRQADAHKDEFLGLLAHELRNPLTPISNCVELLSRRSHDPHAVAKVEEILARQVRHLTHLVDDLLDVTRVARGKVVLKRERLNLIELVNQCIDDHRAALERAGLVLAVNLPEVPIHVDGDQTRICQVFSNLLGNAIKFCPRGSSISIDVTLDAPQRRVAIHVTDTGEGIEPALLTRIFEPFFQSDNDLTRTNGGLGLGLALARGLVELHGGRLEARSEGKGRGAEFVVSLPLADTAELVAGAVDGGVTPLTAFKPLSARVLLIDDNADAAASLATLLELEGCQVLVADTARGGIDLALKFCPDAVLCDIGLPAMDGYAFAREARQHPQLRSALLMALTGYSSPADRLRAEQAGFDIHMTKPPDFDRIVELLRNPAAARQRALRGPD